MAWAAPCSCSMFTINSPALSPHSSVTPGQDHSWACLSPSESLKAAGDYRYLVAASFLSFSTESTWILSSKHGILLRLSLPIQSFRLLLGKSIGGKFCQSLTTTSSAFCTNKVTVLGASDVLQVFDANFCQQLLSARSLSVKWAY